MPQNHGSPRQLIIPLALAVFAAALAVWFSYPAPALPLDDAYIHLTFARNLADGHGFAFNPGERSLGFTSPLWVCTLALLDRLGADPEPAARLLGILAAGAGCAVFSLLVRSSLKPTGSRARFAAVAGFALALSGNLIWLSASGMETSLYLSLSLLAILLLRTDHPRPVPGGIVLGLAVLARPTGFLLAIILIAALALSRKTRPTLAAASALLLVSAPWLIYSFASTGFWLPPTRAGKLASNLANSGLSPEGISRFLSRHLVYFWQVDLDILAFFLLAGGAGLVALRRRLAERPTDRSGPLLAPSPAALLAVWALLDLLMHAVFFRSTAYTTPMHYLRYSAMLIPAAIALATIGLGRLAANASEAAGAFLFSLLLVPLAVECSRVPAWRSLYLQHTSQIFHEHRAAALYIRDQLPGDARVACLDIGALGYFSGRHIIDLGGLTDPDILLDLADRNVGKYLVRRHATHYLEMVRHDSERIVGVRADDGRLYRLEFIRAWHFPAYVSPLLLHSLGMNLYEVQPLPEPHSGSESP